MTVYVSICVCRCEITIPTHLYDPNYMAEMLVHWDRAVLPAWGAGPYLPALVLERPIFVREMSDGLYTAFTYLTYKVSS